ncbi:MAG: Asp-tRNA(Asn)/Glu-tRNA(Gln) amidotransferase subunit GatB [Gemmatimonadaceae bacterium]
MNRHRTRGARSAQRHKRRRSARATVFGAPPNALTCPVCLGLRAYPVLNAHAVELAAAAALATRCTVRERSVFARKYFYPDLPKGYQISQFDQPLAVDGLVVVQLGDGLPRRTHPTRAYGGRCRQVDPRSVSRPDGGRPESGGHPLIEIVTHPDLRSAAKAGVFLRQLKRTMEYLQVSDANMEEGSLRVDANVSVRRHGDAELGTKAEIKNMNSFSNTERAIEVEFARQCQLLERGERVRQETLLWDANRGEVRPARSKEESHDYRYFPDPDLPALLLTTEWIERQRAALPELPVARRDRFVAVHGLSAYDADVLTADRALADYFEAVAQAHGDAKAAAHWVMGEVQAVLNHTGQTIDRFAVSPTSVSGLLDMIRDGVVSHSAGKKIFLLMVSTGEAPRTIAEREGLLQVRDDHALQAWVDQVCAESPEEVRRLQAGEQKLLGALVGKVMKKSGGRADPRKVSDLLTALAKATS